MSLNRTISRLCISNRSKEENKQYKLYVYPFKKAGYKGTEKSTSNQNYRVMVKINGSAKTLAYTKSIETANELAKAIRVTQKEFKNELRTGSSVL